MTKGTVLITDSLFIFEEHERMILDAGYEIFRLDKPKATEEELCREIVGKVGYILGGVEEVTEKVLIAADKLKVISFTGAGFSEFIPGYETAREKGIAITTAQGGNSASVAEFTIALCLSAIREIFAITDKDGPNFRTTRAASETVLGIVGFGNVGQRVAELALGLGFSVLVHSRREPKSLPAEVRFVSMDELLRNSDLITLHVDKVNGTEVISSDEIASMRDGACLINVAFREAVEMSGVLSAVESGKIRYYADHTVDETVNYPVGSLIGTNSQSAYNTRSALRNVSTLTTRSLLSVLQTGDDEYRVI